MQFHKLFNPIVCFSFSFRHHQPQICLRCGRKDRQDAQTIPRTCSQQVQSIRFRFLFMRTYEHGLRPIVSFYDAQVFTRSISALWLGCLQVNKKLCVFKIMSHWQDAQTTLRTLSQQVQSIRFRFLFMRTYEHGLRLIVSFYDTQVFTRSISTLWLASLQVNKELWGFEKCRYFCILCT